MLRLPAGVDMSAASGLGQWGQQQNGDVYTRWVSLSWSCNLDSLGCDCANVASGASSRGVTNARAGLMFMRRFMAAIWRVRIDHEVTPTPAHAVP